MSGADQAVSAAILLCVAGAVLVWVFGRKKTVAGWLTFLITLSASILVLLSVVSAANVQ
jgi:dolichol kinase